MSRLTREELTRLGLLTTCREVIDGEVGVVIPGVCGKQAEFILWGKLFPPEALGPRCYSHATKYVDVLFPSFSYALVDLRPLLRALEDEDALVAAETVEEFTEAVRTSFTNTGGQAVPVPSGPRKRERIEFMADVIAAGDVPAVDYCADGERVEMEHGWAHVVFYGHVGFGETRRSYPAHVIAQVIHRA